MNIKNIMFDESEGISTISLLGNYAEKQTYFLIQTSDEYTTQDVSLKMDRPYYEYNDQVCSQYGGVKNVDYSDYAITFTLEADANISKRIESNELTFTFDKEIAVLERLKKELQKIHG